ncbi:hypothetical protein BS47DRAFT_1111314 [Hydnum rufescens UP504]|uniref:Uncharacterized protein n=1 Tax=Hydnum rufescens UP504 TaxID=1448309 RepID=A0A9P6DUY0_9AGAM|nr:hypothetical protein BS47DRAFT_1111314 [Hydnum rufescens UP504]
MQTLRRYWTWYLRTKVFEVCGYGRGSYLTYTVYIQSLDLRSPALGALREQPVVAGKISRYSSSSSSSAHPDECFLIIGVELVFLHTALHHAPDPYQLNASDQSISTVAAAHEAQAKGLDPSDFTQEEYGTLCFKEFACLGVLEFLQPLLSDRCEGYSIVRFVGGPSPG